MSNVRVVIPSLRGDVAPLSAICSTAARVGASPVVIANSSSLQRQLANTAIPHLTSGSNDGFAASIMLGAAEPDWDWLVVLNDDLRFDPVDLASCLAPANLDALGTALIVHFDNEAPRRIPKTRLSVMMRISLLYSVGRRVLGQLGADRLNTKDYFRSFSAVAIDRAAWDLAGGLDVRYSFTYEDADFVRRAKAAGVTEIVRHTGIVHEHSQTTAGFVCAVIPVSTWSAFEYLNKWCGRRNLNRVLLIIALCVRAPIAAVFLPGARNQLCAVRDSIKALASDARPSLPEWHTV